MPDDPLKNPDRDEEHQRRRDLDGSDEEDPDGRAVARALYGGNPGALEDEEGGDSDTEGEPTLFTTLVEDKAPE
jgi:hypothetical protein